MVKSLYDVTKRKKDGLMNHILEMEGLYREWRTCIKSGDIERIVSAIELTRVKHTEDQLNHVIDSFTKEVERNGGVTKHILHFKKKSYLERNFHSQDVLRLFLIIGLPVIGILVLLAVLRAIYW
jgi:vacuolar-type H+-ATPase subunit D/Vma8